MSGKITKRIVDTLTPLEKDVFFWDNALKGYGIKVTPKGRKVYIVQFRLPGSPTKRYTIGQHGSPWTPDSARTEALKVLGMIASGIDPAADRRAAKSDITVSALCDLYEDEGGQTKKASTRHFDHSLINAHIKPLLGALRVKALAKPDIDRFVRDIASGKTARTKKTRKHGRSIIRGGPAAANRCLGLLSPILEFSVERGVRTDNPARGVKKFKEGRSTRFLSRAEMSRLGDSLRAAESAGENQYAINAIRLLMLTGCRKNEILTLTWDQVDFERGFLRLADSKTGAKNIHIAKPVCEILKSLPRSSENPFVIVGSKEGQHLVNLQKIWTRIRNTAGLEDVRLHDLRHSFASIGAKSGESLLVIGKILGHATSSATARYAHLSDDPVRSAIEAMSAEVWLNMMGQTNGH